MSNETQKTAKTEPPRTEAPRSDQKTELPFPGNLFASFDPMACLAYWTASQQAFQKAMTDAQGRLQSFEQQYAAVESQLVARAHGAVTTWAQLTQDAIAYCAQLTAEARKMGLETARKLTPGA